MGGIAAAGVAAWVFKPWRSGGGDAKVEAKAPAFAAPQRYTPAAQTGFCAPQPLLVAHAAAATDVLELRLSSWGGPEAPLALAAIRAAAGAEAPLIAVRRDVWHALVAAGEDRVDPLLVAEPSRRSGGGGGGGGGEAAVLVMTPADGGSDHGASTATEAAMRAAVGWWGVASLARADAGALSPGRAEAVSAAGVVFAARVPGARSRPVAGSRWLASSCDLLLSPSPAAAVEAEGSGAALSETQAAWVVPSRGQLEALLERGAA